jgi:hypothetical protein
MKKFLITLTLILTLAACIPQSKGKSILWNQVCGKSCWNKIVIGKTTKQELLEIISTLPNVDQTSVTITDDPNASMFDGKIVFQYYRISGEKDTLVNIAVLTKNQIIVFMIFQGDLGLTFQDVVDAYGEPDFASSLWTFDGGINVHFINSLQGVEITQYFNSEKSSVAPDVEVKNLTLFDTKQYQTFLESNLLTGDYEGFVMYPWTGYGKIEDHYWPPQ